MKKPKAFVGASDECPNCGAESYTGGWCPKCGRYRPESKRPTDQPELDPSKRVGQRIREGFRLAKLSGDDE